MADWHAELPNEAVEGAETHVEDHNLIVGAIKEIRDNVDEIELTPGPPGDDAELPFSSDEITALKAMAADYKDDSGGE